MHQIFQATYTMSITLVYSLCYVLSKKVTKWTLERPLLLLCPKSRQPEKMIFQIAVYFIHLMRV